jgi:hypothetical protein
MKRHSVFRHLRVWWKSRKSRERSGLCFVGCGGLESLSVLTCRGHHVGELPCFVLRVWACS